jgi:tetratricopeptide (TPR) repeat protein
MATRRRKPRKQTRQLALDLKASGSSVYWLRSAVSGAVLVIAVFAAYHPAWHGSFLWEDELYTNANPLLTAADGLRRIWFSLDSPVQYFPLTHTAFRIERTWWGLEPARYHLVNIFLHSAGAVVLWRLLRRLAVPAAWFGAALFALHPVQVESVAQISELKNVLMGLCFIATLFFWVVYLDTRRADCWFASFGCYLLALAAKTTACVMPVSLFLVLWWRKERITWKTGVEIAPFVLGGAVAGLVALAWEKFNNSDGSVLISVGSVERVLIASRAIFFYLSKLIWPAELIFSYPTWNISRFHPADYVWPVALLLLAGATYVARSRLGRGPEVALLFFVSALLPLLGFVAIYTFRYTFVADHYQYLACIGPLALFAAGCAQVSKGQRQLSFVVPACVLALLSVLTWKQAHVYQSAESLWADTARKNPGSWMAENNYGTVLTARHEVRAALAHFQRAYDLAPDNLESARNMGISFLELQQPAAALPYLQKAVRINKWDVQARRDLGRALLQLGRGQDALENLDEALEIDPNDAKAHTLTASVLMGQGRQEEAMSHLRRALSLQPEDVETKTQLANLFLQLQQNRDAAELLRQILVLRPDDPDALKNCAWLLATVSEPDLRNGDRAVTLAERARVRAPQNPFIQATLAAAYAEAGRFREARLVAENALRISEANHLDGLTDLLRKEIALFENEQPYRDIR